jgi:hypothetical protein
MINNHRRNFIKLMTLLGLSTVITVASPLKETLKQRKSNFESTRIPTMNNGYYAFGETW